MSEIKGADCSSIYISLKKRKEKKLVKIKARLRQSTEKERYWHNSSLAPFTNMKRKARKALKIGRGKKTDIIEP